MTTVKTGSKNYFPIHLSTLSCNSKTGPMATVTTGSITCPTECRHKTLDTCYAKYSFLGIHWKKVDSGSRDIGWNTFIQRIRELPVGSQVRWGQAGDLPGVGNKIDKQKMIQLVENTRHLKMFTYTHKPLTKGNLSIIEYANNNGFTVNISCDSISDALNLQQKFTLLGYEIPITTTVPENYSNEHPNIKICPAQLTNIHCNVCQWCMKNDRKFIVAFKAHGTKKGAWTCNEDI